MTWRFPLVVTPEVLADATYVAEDRSGWGIHLIPRTQRR
jgi:hypothetical protein